MSHRSLIAREMLAFTSHLASQSPPLMFMSRRAVRDFAASIADGWRRIGMRRRGWRRWTGLPAHRARSPPVPAAGPFRAV